MIYKSSWRDLRPDTPVGWATETMWGKSSLHLGYSFGDTNTLVANLGGNQGAQNTIDWLKNVSPTFQLDMNCYYVNTENDIWLAQVTLFAHSSSEVGWGLTPSWAIFEEGAKNIKLEVLEFIDVKLLLTFTKAMRGSIIKIVPTSIGFDLDIENEAALWWRNHYHAK